MTPAIPAWRQLVYRHKWGIIAANVCQDLLRRTGVVAGQISTPYVGSQYTADLPDALTVIDGTFETYSRHTEISGLNGARVLELGPGHNIGIALRFIGEGASTVVCVDKFVPFQDSPFHRILYSAVRARLDEQGRRRFDGALRIEPSLQIYEPRLRYLFGRDFTEATAPLPQGTFDLIVSNAVVQEIYGAAAAFEAMDRLLAPGGRMIHVIDLRDYSFFAKHGFHPLEFVTVPDPIYRRMVECVGQSNRRLITDYRETMAALAYTATIEVTWVIGAARGLETFTTALVRGLHYSEETAALIETIRPRLLERYRRMAQEELAAGGILLVATKPAIAS